MKNKIYLLEVGRGRDIKEEIGNFMKEKDWDYAYISGAIGSITDITVANPVSNKFPIEIKTTDISGPCEVLSFTGEIMKKEFMKEELKTVYKDYVSDLFVHIHMSCSSIDASVFGGGFHKAKVFRALNIFIQELYIRDED